MVRPVRSNSTRTDTTVRSDQPDSTDGLVSDLTDYLIGLNQTQYVSGPKR